MSLVSECVNIFIVDDNVTEGDHDLTIKIESTSIPSVVVISEEQRQHTAKIQDNDGKTLPHVVKVLVLLTQVFFIHSSCYYWN